MPLGRKAANRVPVDKIVIAEVGRLIKMERDAIEAYEEFLRNSLPVEVRMIIEEILKDEEDHLAKLRDRVLKQLEI